MTEATAILSASRQSADLVADLLESRRTINFFRGDTPPRELIEKSIDLARWAPNHHLTEPWHFYLLSDDAKAQVVSLNTELVRARRGDESAAKKQKRWSEIPGWIAITCDKNEDPDTFLEDYAAVSCAIHNMCLYLWTMGVGTKWTSGPVTKDPAFYDIIWVDPTQEHLVGLLWYGYPEEIPTSARKPVEQILVDV